MYSVSNLSAYFNESASRVNAAIKRAGVTPVQRVGRARLYNETQRDLIGEQLKTMARVIKPS